MGDLLKAINSDLHYYKMLTYSLEDNNSSSALIEEANYKQTRISTLVIEAIDIVIEDETTGWPNVIY